MHVIEGLGCATEAQLTGAFDNWSLMVVAEVGRPIGAWCDP